MDSFQFLPFLSVNIVGFVMIMTRISVLFATFSVFKHEIVTPRIVLALSVILSFYALTLAPQSIGEMELYSVAAFKLMIMQMLLGVIGGIILNIVFEMFLVLGQLVSTQTGLSMAGLIDQRFGYITSLSNFYIITATFLFFYLNGHLFVIEAIINSFYQIPLIAVNLNQSLLQEILNFSSIIFVGGVKLSITITIVLLITNISIAVVTKFAPQVNLFSIGINIELIVGLITVYLTYHLITSYSQNLLIDCLHFFAHYLRSA